MLRLLQPGHDSSEMGEKCATDTTCEDDSSALSLRSSDFLTRPAFLACLAV